MNIAITTESEAAEKAWQEYLQSLEPGHLANFGAYQHLIKDAFTAGRNSRYSSPNNETKKDYC